MIDIGAVLEAGQLLMGRAGLDLHQHFSGDRGADRPERGGDRRAGDESENDDQKSSRVVVATSHGRVSAFSCGCEVMSDPDCLAAGYLSGMGDSGSTIFG